jgi:hypothetical protein
MPLLYNSEYIVSTADGIGVKSSLYGPAIDVRDCNGVLFILSGNTEGQGKDSSGYFHLQCSTYSSGGWVNYGTTIACNSTITGNVRGTMIIDAYKPTKPFLRAAWYTCTGIQHLTCLKYGMRKAGTTEARDTTHNYYHVNISSS